MILSDSSPADAPALREGPGPPGKAQADCEGNPEKVRWGAFGLKEGWFRLTFRLLAGMAQAEIL